MRTVTLRDQGAEGLSSRLSEFASSLWGDAGGQPKPSRSRSASC